MFDRNNTILTLTATLVFGLGLAPIINAQSPTAVRASEKSLRKIATHVVMPDYPEEARKRGDKGVAVADLEIDGKGDVVYLDVLEAPDVLIKQAVLDAVKQWKFSPTTIGDSPVSVRGKLTFYYIINEKGVGRVENPRQFN